MNTNGASCSAAALHESFPGLAAVLRGGDVAAAVAALPAERLTGVLVEIATLQTQLAAASHAISARLLAAPATALGVHSGDHGRMLTVREAAARLGLSPDYLYRHQRQLPFMQKVGTRTLRCPEAALTRWQASRRA